MNLCPNLVNSRILITEFTYDNDNIDINGLAHKLRLKAPHIDWVVEEREILGAVDIPGPQLCLLVPKAQYNAAKNVYQLVVGNTTEQYHKNPAFIKLQEKLNDLSWLYSPGIEEDEVVYLSEFSKLLSEVYALGQNSLQVWILL